jgi:capsular polysaccharide transport system ATP-binding protein
MAIELRNVCMRTRNTLTPVSVNDVSLRIGAGQQVAILSPDRARLAMLIDVICGANAPDSGSAFCDSRLSWPLPRARFLHNHQTFVANARFIARLYEMDQKSFIDRVIEMAGIAELADERVGYCPKDAISRFTFALGACLPFDIYFFTATNIGDKKDRKKYAGIIAELGRRSGLLLAMSAGKMARNFCDKAYVIEERGAVYYDDMDAAIEHLERLAKKKPEEDSDEQTPDQEEAMSDDFV